jgi:sugar lactone lactonase YvrE
LVGKISALTLCSTAVWAVNATTVAGSRSGSSGYTSKKLELPTGVFVDNTSAIYVADSSNYRVQRFPSGSTTGVTVINGSYGTGLNQFSSSKHTVQWLMFVCIRSLSILVDSMTIDTSGNIYILDGDLARVTIWAPKATSGILLAGGSNYSRYYDYQYGYNPNYYSSDNNSDYYYYYYNYVDEYNEPSGMFIELQTMIIWIADTYNSQILKWPNPSTRIVVCGSYGSGSNQFNAPRGLFVDTNAGGILYVADTNNHRIQMWTPGAISGTTLAGMTPYFGDRSDQLYYPQTLVVDTNQNMFIVDGGNNRIVKWTIGASSGVIIAGSNTEGTLANQLYNPYSIAFDSSGSLFVCDAENNRIQKFAISCRKNHILLLFSFLSIFCFCTASTNISTTTTPPTITTAGKHRNYFS